MLSVISLPTYYFLVSKQAYHQLEFYRLNAQGRGCYPTGDLILQSVAIACIPSPTRAG